MHKRIDSPRVWILLGQKGGDNAQVRTLANLLGWPCTEKQLCFNGLSRRFNILLGASLDSLTCDSAPLEPPWPSLVISIGKRSVPAARWIKRRSGEITRLVHLGRPWAPLSWFDLVVTTPQYRLPSRPNVIHNTLPVIRHEPQCLSNAGIVWAERFRALPRPWTAFLVGGPSRPFTLDQHTAASLGEAVSAHARQMGGSLLVTASRRCPPASFRALAGEIHCPGYIHDPFDAHQGNPYLAYLALADRFVVTCDSASMIAEACLTGKPVSIIDLPVSHDRKMRRTEFLRSILLRKRGGVGESIYECLVDFGLITSTRDLRYFVDNLKQKRLITRLGEPVEAQVPLVFNEQDLERTCARIRSLLEPRES
ncbi:mitochondrial fission ELM1 family protein [Pelobacter propionicus]|uniref:Nucleoside-diphosphate-sugar epimerase-like protein n=1 Tax=Pelobacter propionicus (strain DSM 2379 / NBRC 103807 / OttBd1) TaxID=338966 RepID=A1ASP4_PELPD|nr:mitochondrial fission ELM1 family protein [Pelobacter propionicus]ABL00365.1 nucleoside-diphosphate-sugar epimerase-like protein [Pelobacter propionicus DSM 2379]